MYDRTASQLDSVRANRTTSEDTADIDTAVQAEAASRITESMVERAARGKGVARPVAIKIRHPYMREVIDLDLAIMRWVARWIARIPSFQSFAVGESVEQFASVMYAQLDLSREADSLYRFMRNFDQTDTDRQSIEAASNRGGAKWTWNDVYFKLAFWEPRRKRPLSEDVVFPEPIRPFTTESVLVEQYEEGIPVQYFIDRPSAFSHDIANIGLTAFLKMVLIDNFVHADLHPGTENAYNRI